MIFQRGRRQGTLHSSFRAPPVLCKTFMIRPRDGDIAGGRDLGAVSVQGSTYPPHVLSRFRVLEATESTRPLEYDSLDHNSSQPASYADATLSVNRSGGMTASF